MLLNQLHALQQQHGYLPQAELEELARRLRRREPKMRIEGGETVDLVQRPACAFGCARTWSAT